MGTALSIYMILVHWQDGSVVGFNFYSLDPATGKASGIGTTRRGADETDPGFYRHALPLRLFGIVLAKMTLSMLD